MNRNRHLPYVARQAGITFPLLLAFLCTACSGENDPKPNASLSTMDMLDTTFFATTDGIYAAVTTPLHDLNIMEDEIPGPLATISGNPYALPNFKRCNSLRDEMALLNSALGPDVDAPKLIYDDIDSATLKGTGMIKDAAVGFVNAQANVLPVRDVLRSISGANAHDKEMNKAIEAGKLRRAYLRGIALAKFGSTCDFNNITTTQIEKKTVFHNPADAVLEVADKL
ncbi:MAG: hypothetical protein ACKVOE_04685 [Rickettsiales bacterium]